MCAAPSSAPERPVFLEDHLGMTLREWIERYQSQIVTKQLRYKGVRIWKNVLDLWTYQELIFETRPTVVVETGACAQPFIITGVNILEPPGVVVWSIIVVVLIVHGPCSIDMRMPP